MKRATESLTTQAALMYLGVFVTLSAALIFLVRYSEATETEERQALNQALARRAGLTAAGAVPVPAARPQAVLER